MKLSSQGSSTNNPHATPTKCSQL